MDAVSACTNEVMNRLLVAAIHAVHSYLPTDRYRRVCVCIIECIIAVSHKFKVGPSLSKSRCKYSPWAQISCQDIVSETCIELKIGS